MSTEFTNPPWKWLKEKFKKRVGEDRLIILPTPGKVEKLSGTCDFKSDLLAALKLLVNKGKSTMKTAMSHPIPENLEQCFEQLTSMFKDEEKELFKQPDRKGKCSAYRYHHGMGQWIRNNWGFWKKEGPLYNYMVELGLNHPDDMSGLILDAFWHHLNEVPFSTEAEVKRYQDYWENQKAPPGGAALNYEPQTVVRTTVKKNFKIKETFGTRWITEERVRQINEEGFTTEHDISCHPNEEILMAAICYAAAALEPDLKKKLAVPSDFWPFHESWNKSEKQSDIRNLEMAGALIAAEIDRRNTIRIDETCSEECEIKDDDTTQS